VVIIQTVPDDAAAARRNGPLITVKLSNTTTTTRNINAAKPLIKKSVFLYWQRRSIFLSIRAFVTDLPVDVLSCFETNQADVGLMHAPVVDHRAFRLGIARDDRDRLLDASMYSNIGKVLQVVVTTTR
jgi:hypothetical protein